MHLIGVLWQANGSARVRLGATDVIASIKVVLSMISFDYSAHEYSLNSWLCLSVYVGIVAFY